MKDLGEYLKNKRIENGISIDEVSEDLKIEVSALENIESGNVRAFKDMYVLKDLVRDYAKYLGLDVNYVVDEFNDFLFTHTSKISLEDIQNSDLLKQKKEEKKVISPYTAVVKEKKDYSIIFKIIAGFILITIILFIMFNMLNKKEIITEELKGCLEYEFTYKTNSI